MFITPFPPPDTHRKRLVELLQRKVPDASAEAAGLAEIHEVGQPADGAESLRRSDGDPTVGVTGDLSGKLRRAVPSFLRS